MKPPPLLLLVVLVSSSAAVDTNANPIQKVIDMIAGLQSSCIQEGEDEQKAYNKYSEMCSDRSRELHQEIKTGKATSQDLTAVVSKAAADIAVFQEKISSTASAASDADAELKTATGVRNKEAADFKADEAEMQRALSTLERAISIIKRDGPKASLAQVQSMESVTQVLQAMAEASQVNSYDAAKLTALVQSSSASSQEDSEDEDEDDAAGAPSAATYKKQSGGIVETMENVLEKAQGQLEESRQAEAKAKNAYELVQQSLVDRKKTLDAELSEAKSDMAATEESKATAEGDLQSTKKELAEDIKDLEDLHRGCMDKATAFEDSTTARNEELKALAEAKKIIVESTGGAEKQEYNLVQTSFLQVRSASSSDAASSALHVVRQLAYDVRSPSMLELSNRIWKAVRVSDATGADPFRKVKGLISDMINKLQDEAEADATKKAYCDKEMGETQNAKADKEDDIEKLSTKIDVMSSKSKKLKAQVATTKKELAELARAQAKLDQARQEEKALFKKNKPEMEQGLEGVKKALKVLRDYYAKDDSSSGGGAAGGIVGMLEVVESDFTKSIANMISAEEQAQSEYNTETNDNSVSRATKEEDAKFKTAEYVALDKSITEATTDRTGVDEELSAVLEYFKGIKKECIAKPDSYAERVKKREREMAGLKEALERLEADAALIQLKTSHRTLRGSLRLAIND